MACSSLYRIFSVSSYCLLSQRRVLRATYLAHVVCASFGSLVSTVTAATESAPSFNGVLLLKLLINFALWRGHLHLNYAYVVSAVTLVCIADLPCAIRKPLCRSIVATPH